MVEDLGPTPFLIIGLKDLGARVSLESYHLRVEAHLGGIYVQNTVYHDPYDEDEHVYLVRGPVVTKMKFIPGGEPHLFDVRLTLADPFGPEFISKYKNTEISIAVKFSSLLVYGHQEAFLVIFNWILEVYLKLYNATREYEIELQGIQQNFNNAVSNAFEGAKTLWTKQSRRQRRIFARRGAEKRS